MKRKKFLKLPEYPGGKTEMSKFIRENLRYPKEALQNRIEGVVHLSAQIDDNGHVFDIQVIKGIGYGCDEEAARVVSLMHFGGVTNRGYRLKSTKKFRIAFQLSSTAPVQYQFVEEKKTAAPPEERKFSYTIRLG